MDTQTLSILIGLVILVVAGGVIYLAFSQSKNKETVAFLLEKKMKKPWRPSLKKY